MAVALGDQHLGGDVIEKGPVVAHQQQGALIALQRVFEQLERLDVKIVGRFVEHQQIGRPGKEPGQQQAVAFATREHAHRRLRATRRKQEIAEIAHDMLALATDLHPFGAGADRLGHGLFGIELLAHLIEIGHLQLRAEAALAGISLERAQDQFEDGRLAGAVGADQAEMVAAHQVQ